MTDSDGSEEAPFDEDLPGVGEVPRVHKPRRALPTDIVRPTRAEVHLSHLRHNLNLLKKASGRAPLWAVLKADGYGHGGKAVARILERAGADGVCVALVEEGIELREAGIRIPILVMGGYYGGAFREFAQHDLTPVLSDPGQVESLERAAQHLGVSSFRCHVKVDTGMARLGTRKPEWPRLIAEVKKSRALLVEGLMTHLASADVSEPDALTAPLVEFEEARSLFRREGVLPRLAHVANSAALLRDRRTHYQMVRPGIALFGVDPTADLPTDMRHDSPLEGRLKPTMSVVSRIVSLRELASGDAVGYGGTFVAQRKTIVATVPMGYADGLARMISGRASALVAGTRVPLIGTVSMDMTMIDVTEIPDVTTRDEVVFLGHQKGRQGEDTITPQEMAKWSGSIPWEVLTNISRRVPRFYREA